MDDAAAPAAQARAVVRRAGTSFYWAMRLLPAAKREAMFAIYAYSREVDDIADRPAPAADKRRDLAAWGEEIEALYEGRPRRPLARALAEPVARFALDKEDFLDILRGVTMDANGPIRAPRLDELDLYCTRVAGAVGLLSVKVFGCNDARAPAFALATGGALQLTNILRDLDEDRRDGRLYLPRELLDDAGIDGDDPDAVLRHPALPKACAALAERARDKFEESQNLLTAMSAADVASLRPALIMGAIYRRLLARLVARGWSRIDQPASLGKAEKLWIALRICAFGR